MKFKMKPIADLILEFYKFGKVKDIDFSDELFYEPLDGEDIHHIIISIDFEEGIVELGERVDFGCDCCGSYYDSTYYNLDQLANNGYLGLLLDRLGDVLNKKVGV